MTAQTLTRAMPGLSLARARALLPHLERAMREGHITTRARAAAFLAQLGHESVSLRYFEEIASGGAYEGRRDLGNVRPGDGKRYKGRGPIQLTGRHNYRVAGRALRLPLEAQPWLAARADVGFRVAVWYWTTHGLNGLADRGQFDAITRSINGGYNGHADRRNRWAICRKLGKAILPTKPDPVARLPKHEREMVSRLRHHRSLYRRGSRAARVKNLAWGRWWRAKIHRQMARLARDARRRGGGGWKRDGRGWRYQILGKVYAGKL